jgi:muramoyltetrapeptide carboxypeptidase LdcA involved in peptidoglycan recycling
MLNNFLIQEWGWSVVSAPVLAQVAFKKVSELSIKTILDFLNGEVKELEYELELLNKINFESLLAPVVGGCMSVLSGAFATKNQLDWEGKILFLEDEGEYGERLDRYFTQIVTVMVEQRKLPCAILLGNFLEANPHGTPKAENIGIAIAKFVEKITENDLRIPVFAERTKCLGHSWNMMPLVLNCESKIGTDLRLVQRVG